LAFNAALVVAQLGSLIVGGWVLKDARAAIAMLAATSAIINALLCGYLLSASGVSLIKGARFALRYALCALPTLAAGACAKWILHLDAWAVVLVVIIASVSYFAGVVHYDHWARSLLRSAAARLISR
jgi:hypothetical protein